MQKLRDWLNCGEKVKIENNFIKSLIKTDDPIPLIGEKLLNIWLKYVNGELKDYYYNGEKEVFMFEEFLLNIYNEFFTNELPKACFNATLPCDEVNNDFCYIILDGMSLREGVLLYNNLKNSGFSAKIRYSLSALPSDTKSFREKIKKDFKDRFKYINNPKNINIDGDEQYIWSYFPDILLDKIQVGHTIISDLESMYKTTEKILFDLIDKINTRKILIFSDHGYIRSEAGFTFTVPEDKKKILREIFGSSRFIPMDKANLNDLVNEGYVIEFGGYYLIKSRFIWPVPGKYNVYLHGGVSLMECFVPLIEVGK